MASTWRRVPAFRTGREVLCKRMCPKIVGHDDSCMTFSIKCPDGGERSDAKVSCPVRRGGWLVYGHPAMAAPRTISTLRIDYLTALTIMAEIADISRFQTPWKLVPYAGLSPTHRDSSGKIRRGRITKRGSRWLRYVIVEAANTAKVREDRLKAFYERIAPRRGPQKGRVVTGKEMLVIIWYVLTRNEPYRGMKRKLLRKSIRKWKETSSNG